jgi:hypothetical protein
MLSDDSVRSNGLALVSKGKAGRGVNNRTTAWVQTTLDRESRKNLDKRDWSASYGDEIPSSHWMVIVRKSGDTINKVSTARGGGCCRWWWWLVVVTL